MKIRCQRNARGLFAAILTLVSIFVTAGAARADEAACIQGGAPASEVKPLAEATAALASHITDSVAVRAGRSLVDACASRTRGKKAEADYTSTELCKKNPALIPDFYTGDTVKYRMSNEGGQIRIDMNLRLKIADDGPPSLGKSLTEYMLVQTTMCMMDVSEFWQRYGLDVRIHLDSEEEPFYAKDNVSVIHLGRGRSNSAELYFSNQDGNEPAYARFQKSCQKAKDASGCISFEYAGKIFDTCNPEYHGSCSSFVNKIKRNDFCLTFLHETGHLLGLPDRYADPSCPERKEISQHSEPFSVMDNAAKGWSNIEFFPEDLEIVLQPLCGK